MPTKISKDQTRMTVTEYDVRPIDEYGDCIDPQHAETLDAARALADKIEAQGKIDSTPVAAIIIERHVARHPAHLFADGDTYTHIEHRGSGVALAAGGWLA